MARSRSSRKKAQRTNAAATAGFSEETGAPYDAAATPNARVQTVELGAGGRLVIPASMRSALGIKVGDRLTVRLDGRQLRIYTFEEGLRQARQIIGKYLPAGADPVEDFLQWKREQAALEEAKLKKWSSDD